MGTVISIINWIVFGLIVGALARFVLPGKQDMSIVMTILLGVLGSFLGGTISRLIFGAGEGFIQPSGWIMSILGAVIALLIYSAMKTKGKAA
jgi:uncharacterized membrane protein YeaQ/YmgE (transglycosylase-associated protein family)